MSQIENLACIRDKGIRKFLADERKRWMPEECVFCAVTRSITRNRRARTGSPKEASAAGKPDE